jgi:hypothetical protein
MATKSKKSETETKAESNGEKAKKECVVTRSQFRDKAPAAVQVTNVVAVKKEFESGTMGYYTQVTAVVEIDGVPVKMNGQCQLFIANSKDAK